MIGKKGFSLIEVIICLAIASILSVSAFSLAGYIKNADTKKCGKQLNQKIETARMTTMSKSGDWQFYIYKESDGIYYCLTTDTTLDRSKGKKIGSSSMKLYATKKGETETLLSEGTSEIHMKFTKNTGCFSTEDGASIYKSIRVEGKNSVSITIQLVEKTGKHYIE